MDDRERQVAYGADITYGTNNEFGFDYLRDNMKFDLGMYVQRGHNFAIVDEVDSILIDEARTPLIISGPAEESTDKYYRIDRIIPKLKPGARITGDKKAEERAELEKTGDYIVDEKAQDGHPDRDGDGPRGEAARGAEPLGPLQHGRPPPREPGPARPHPLPARRRLRGEGRRRSSSSTSSPGRLMPGRRWSDGLHQAVEAKEKVKIERENQTLATITFQNYFRMYEKLSGMTGTAETEAAEFDKIYKLEVLVIPTNRPLIRVENPDVVYRTEREKFDAVVDEIEELHEAGRPVLVGTISIEKSEQLSDAAQEGRHQARGAERQVPRARGRDRGPGRPLRRGHHRHQHGRPRDRHHPRRRARPPRRRRPARARSSTRDQATAEEMQAAAAARSRPR